MIVAPDSYQDIRKTIQCLRAQTVKERLEIVIVAPSRTALQLIEAELNEFHSYKVVEVGEILVLSYAKAAVKFLGHQPNDRTRVKERKHRRMWAMMAHKMGFGLAQRIE
ncbi:MAG: hypothetical protein ACREXT_14065 [Gammaproteobacteria bacterium]